MPRTAVTRPDPASTSSTVLITGVTVASARATATAAGPLDEPSRPASNTPDTVLAALRDTGFIGYGNQHVGDETGVTQRRQHGIALRVVHRRDCGIPVDQ